MAIRQIINKDIPIPDIEVDLDAVEHVTVVPDDAIVLINCYGLHFDFPYEKGLHAIQWDNINQTGHMEFVDDLNVPLDQASFHEDILPFIQLFAQAQTNRFEKMISDWENEVAEFNSDSAKMERLKNKRNAILKATDYLVLPDVAAEIGPQILSIIYKYRKLIRNIADQKGAPWDGGGEKTPWPQPPVEILKKATKEINSGNLFSLIVNIPVRPIFNGVKLDAISKEFAKKYPNSEIQ